MLVAMAAGRGDGRGGDEGGGGTALVETATAIALIGSVFKAIRLREEIVLVLWLPVVRHLVRVSSCFLSHSSHQSQINADFWQRTQSMEAPRQQRIKYKKLYYIFLNK
jgi:hypothetical protein